MAEQRSAERALRWQSPLLPEYEESGLVSLGWVDDIIDDLFAFIEAVASRIGSLLQAALSPILQAVSLTLGKIDDFLSNGISAILSAIAAIPDKLASLVDGIASRLESALESIISRLDDLLDFLVNAISAAISSVTSAFVTQLNVLWGKIKDGLDGIIEKVRDIIEAVAGLAERIVEELKVRLSALADKISDLATSLVESVKAFAQRVAEGIKGAYEAATEKIKAVLQELMSRISDTLERLRERFEEMYKEIGQAIEERILTPLSASIKEIKEVAGFKVQVMVKAAMGQYTSWDEFISDITDPVPLLGAAGVVIGQLFLAQIVAPAFSAVMAPVFENLTHLANMKFRPALLPASVAVSALFRGVMNKAQVSETLARSGYGEDAINVLIESARPLPAPAVIQQAYLRGLISKEQHDNMLSQHGYTKEEISLFHSLYYIIPAPPDLIRMAVREAFSPEVATMFGQYEDFPSVFAEWAEKQGLSREWAERYWAAHWELPSATMGFEMLHRRLISKEELKLLLRALDVMPFWREKLIQLSYNPYTRVDIRRMYQLGILDEQGVYNSYLELGYDEDKARRLTDFTLRYYTAEDKSELDEYKTITRNLVEQAYEQEVINREEAIQRLQMLGYRDVDIELIMALSEAKMALKNTEKDPVPLRSQTTKILLDSYQRGLYNEGEVRESLASLGYSETEINWYVALSDYNLVQSLRVMAMDIIKERYVTRTIDRTEAIVQLSALSTTSGEQEKMLSQWEIEREARTRKPTEAQFRAALYAGIIKEEEYREELRGLGFDERYVEMLTALAMRKAG